MINRANKKGFVFIGFFLSLSLLVFAQTSNNYYYANREAHYWHDDSTLLLVR